jgi:hypothetical protein
MTSPADRPRRAPWTRCGRTSGGRGPAWWAGRGGTAPGARVAELGTVAADGPAPGGRRAASCNIAACACPIARRSVTGRRRFLADASTRCGRSSARHAGRRVRPLRETRAVPGRRPPPRRSFGRLGTSSHPGPPPPHHRTGSGRLELGHHRLVLAARGARRQQRLGVIPAPRSAAAALRRPPPGQRDRRLAVHRLRDGRVAAAHHVATIQDRGHRARAFRPGADCCGALRPRRSRRAGPAAGPRSWGLPAARIRSTRPAAVPR